MPFKTGSLSRRPIIKMGALRLLKVMCEQTRGIRLSDRGCKDIMPAHRALKTHARRKNDMARKYLKHLARAQNGYLNIHAQTSNTDAIAKLAKPDPAPTPRMF